MDNGLIFPRSKVRGGFLAIAVFAMAFGLSISVGEAGLAFTPQTTHAAPEGLLTAIEAPKKRRGFFGLFRRRSNSQDQLRRRQMQRQNDARIEQQRRLQSQRRATTASTATTRTVKRKRKVITQADIAPATWLKDAPTDGPVKMVISLEDQRVHVYRDGKFVVSSQISSGTAAYKTPTGLYSVLEKKRRHYSNLYESAPMPHMQRITWDGVALHGGHVPNYPASHGCVRLPYSFARDLFTYTDRGAHVIISESRQYPVNIKHPMLFQRPGNTSIASRSATATNDEPEEREAAELEKSEPAPPPLSPEMIEGYQRYAASRQVITSPLPSEPLRMIITWKKRGGGNKVLDAQKMLTELGYKVGAIDGMIGKSTRAAIMEFREANSLKTNRLVDDEFTAALMEALGRKPTNAKLSVRRGFRNYFEGGVNIQDRDKPLGSHFFTAHGFKEGESEVKWQGLILEPAGGPGSAAWKAAKNMTMTQRIATLTDVLDRIEIPADLRARIESELAPGSSLVITDRRPRKEHHLGSDYILSTRM